MDKCGMTSHINIKRKNLFFKSYKKFDIRYGLELLSFLHFLMPNLKSMGQFFHYFAKLTIRSVRYEQADPIFRKALL